MQDEARGTQKRLLIYAVLNALLLVALGTAFDFPPYVSIAACMGYWITLTVIPGTFNTNFLVTPRNYICALYFISLVISPPLLYGLDTWLVSWTPSFWKYANEGIALWVLSFFFYALASAPRKPMAKNLEINYSKQAPAWILPVAILSIGMGVTTLSLAAGSLSKLLQVRGMRVAAREIINQVGTGRYQIWFYTVPIAAGLLWYYLFLRFQEKRSVGLALVALCYVPLVPFYSYTSGRGDTLLPLFLLIVLYYIYAHRFSVVAPIFGVVLLVPLLSVWSFYRLEGSINLIGVANVSKLIKEAIGVLSRLDVSIAAYAGFREGHMQYYAGETFIAALLHPIPAAILPRDYTGGTMAMAQAIFSDPGFAQPSALATPLLTEGYLNAGIPGVIVVSAALGWLTRFLEGLQQSRDILVATVASLAMFHLPFGAALQVIAVGVVWKVVFPTVVLILFRDVFRILADKLTGVSGD
jgi:hypothetical protein